MELTYNINKLTCSDDYLVNTMNIKKPLNIEDQMLKIINFQKQKNCPGVIKYYFKLVNTY